MLRLRSGLVVDLHQVLKVRAIADLGRGILWPE
jgi:hypothetical protein